MVVDREQMHFALLAMGYRATVRMVKTRRTGTVPTSSSPGGSVQVCVDEVRHAGVFVEAERMVADDEDTAVVQRELAAWLQELAGVGERVSDTYDTLVHAATADEPVVVQPA